MTALWTFLRRRLADESGFVLVIALGVLLVTSLLVGGALVALQGDVRLTGTDLDAKHAYLAARSGVDAFTYQLNTNPNYWATCTNDTQTPTAVPGSTNGETYEWAPIPANGASACNQASVAPSLIDVNTGGFSMKFIGHAGQNPTENRGIVATFRRRSPLDYVWYTVYEAFDPSIGPTYANCNHWYRETPARSTSCNIQWFTGDTIGGPMYTQDQFYISSGASPTFGRSPADAISSLATNSVWSVGAQNTTVNGTVTLGVTVPQPSSNAGLLTDAQNHGKVYSGVTTIALSGTTATVTNCPTTCGAPQTVDLTQNPVIYVQNGSGCSVYSYSPYSPAYNTTGCAGDVYVSGNYTTPLTIAAANNIIITGSVTTTSSGSALTGNGVLGLVANQFVRVEHQIPARPNGSNTYSNCPSGADTLDLPNLTVHAAIVALQHSWIVDNFDCGKNAAGATINLGTLTVKGSIVQYYRGPVSTGAGTPSTGYTKAYSYDDRLSQLEPPYLYDILNASWKLARENTCNPNAPAGNPNASC